MADEASWFVELRGREQNLNEIKQLAGRSDVHLVKSYRCLRLEFPGFSETASPDEVLRKAEEEVALLNALGRLFVDEWYDLLAGVLCVRPRNAPYATGLRLVGALRYHRRSPTRPLSRANLEGATGNRPIDRTYRSCEVDPIVRQILRLVGSTDESFRQLYVILEILERASGGSRALAEKKWKPRKDFRRFRRTANSSSILGDDARHGTEITAPPRDPMGLEEGQAFIRELVTSWLLGIEVTV